MAHVRRALRAWEAHLRETLGMEHGKAIVDEFDHHVSEAYLDTAFDRQRVWIDQRFDQERARVDERFDREHAWIDQRFDREHVWVDQRFDREHVWVDQRFATEREYLDERLRTQTAELTAAWRRDMLLISGGQFFALAATVAAFLALG